MPTGIPGFDYIARGGLPKGRTTLVAGTTGACKTLFAVQFLAHGVGQLDEPGIFVTFDERPPDIRRNAASLGLDIARWEAESRWVFIDGSMVAVADDEMVVGDYDFGGLVSRLRHTAERIHAKRVSFDSLGAVFSRFADAAVVRLELQRVAAALRDVGVTSLITAERLHEQDSISRFGVEEFVADNVVVLRNIAVRDKRQRTVEVLKMRGGPHRTGEWLFTIDPVRGIVVLLLAAVDAAQGSGVTEPISGASDERVTTGVPELDAMCGGGIYRNSIALASGPTGTGKTLLATHFAAAGTSNGERCALLTFDESREQLIRNARGWGFDLEGLERSGRLCLVCRSPEMAPIEDHFLAIADELEAFRPDRLVVDDFLALGRVASELGLRDILLGFLSLANRWRFTTLFTATTGGLGDTSDMEVDLASQTDTIFLLRNVELEAQMRRSLAVLKVRGSVHDTKIREFTIDEHGMHVGPAMAGLSGILAHNLAAAPAQPGGAAERETSQSS